MLKEIEEARHQTSLIKSEVQNIEDHQKEQEKEDIVTIKNLQTKHDMIVRNNEETDFKILEIDHIISSKKLFI